MARPTAHASPGIVLDLPMPRRPDPTPRCDLPGLDVLRTIAARSRLEPRADVDMTCRLLRADPGQAAEAYALALLRTVAAATGRPMRFHRPGSATQTFDEAWVMRLIGALRAGDIDSALFCIASRVPRALHTAVRFLAGGLAERLDILRLEPF